MPLPAGVVPFQPDWPNVVLISLYHLAAFAAFLPICFNWSALIVAVVGLATLSAVWRSGTRDSDQPDGYPYARYGPVGPTWPPTG